MDAVKTGIFIAKRRKDLGITQKALAENLHISDRTVSKWERGAGFPDISLIEPLADTLGIIVTELLHGQDEPKPISPEAERSARKTIQELKKGFSQSMKKARQTFLILRTLSICAIIIAILPALHPIRYERFDINELTPTRALSVCPFVMITGDEYRLISRLMSDPIISDSLAGGTPRDLSTEDIPYLDDELLIGAKPPDSVRLVVTSSSFSVCYNLGRKSCILTYDTTTETFLKVSAEYRSLGSKPRYCIENWDNSNFKRITGARDLLGPSAPFLSNNFTAKGRGRLYKLSRPFHLFTFALQKRFTYLI